MENRIWLLEITQMGELQGVKIIAFRCVTILIKGNMQDLTDLESLIALHETSSPSSSPPEHSLIIGRAFQDTLRD